MRFCPKCQRQKHEEEAAFCCICGTELKNGTLREFYLQLKIPVNKIALEEKEPAYSMFPFFLRKVDQTKRLFQGITLHEYPKGILLYVKLPTKSASADRSDEIILTDTLLDQLLNEGFEWVHHSEYTTMW